MFGLVQVKWLGSFENDQNGFIHNWCTGGCWFTLGWSEPMPTNAPIEDEAVEVILGMNQNTSSLTQSFWFFQPLLCPKNFPSYLPPSHLPPPSYLPHLNLCSFHCQSSRAIRARTTTTCDLGENLKRKLQKALRFQLDTQGYYKEIMGSN